MVLDRLPPTVDEDLHRLREDYGEFPVHEEVVTRPAGAYDPGSADDLFRFASTWIRRDGEVLLVQPIEDDGWVGPGGRMEPGETFESTARRETREETGVDCRLTGIVEARVGLDELGDRASVPWMGVVFAAEFVDGDPRPQPEEIADVGWFSELPDELVFESIADYPL